MIIIGIVIIVLLVVLFFVTYLLNKRTPIPKGCESVAYDVQSCSGCKEVSCEYHMRAEEMIEKMKKEIQEDENK